MPRLIRGDHCPHCKAKLPEPKPRACPNCAGSLNQRYLSIGCLSSAPPPLILIGLGVWALWKLTGA